MLICGLQTAYSSHKMDYYNQRVDNILRWGRMGSIACHIAQKLGIAPLQALKDFYQSRTCANFHNKLTGLYLYGDLYVADNYILELNSK